MDLVCLAIYFWCCWLCSLLTFVLLSLDEVLDHLLDQHDTEIDSQNRHERDTPLHSAVKYSLTEPEHGAFIVEMLIDAGADPRIKNKAGQKPIDLAADDNDALIDVLQGAEFARMAGPEPAGMIQQRDMLNGMALMNVVDEQQQAEGDEGDEGSSSDKE